MSDDWKKDCKQWFDVDPAQGAKIADALSQFEEGGALAGISPVQKNISDAVTLRLYGTTDKSSLSKEQRRSRNDMLTGVVGLISARYTEWKRGECWRYMDETLMPRIIEVCEHPEKFVS